MEEDPDKRAKARKELLKQQIMANRAKDMTLDEVFRLAPIMEDQTEEVPSAATISATSSATVSARPPPNPAVPNQPRPQSFPQFAPKKQAAMAAEAVASKNQPRTAKAIKFRRPEQRPSEEQEQRQQKEDEKQLATLLKTGANQRVAKMDGFMPDKSRPKAPGTRTGYGPGSGYRTGSATDTEGFNTEDDELLDSLVKSATTPGSRVVPRDRRKARVANRKSYTHSTSRDLELDFSAGSADEGDDRNYRGTTPLSDAEFLSDGGGGGGVGPPAPRGGGGRPASRDGSISGGGGGGPSDAYAH